MMLLFSIFMGPSAVRRYRASGTAGSDPTGSRGKRWNRGFGSNGFSRKTLEPRFGSGSDPNPFALLGWGPVVPGVFTVHRLLLTHTATTQ